MFKFKNTLYLLKFACRLKPTITVIWDTYIKVVVYQYFIRNLTIFWNVLMRISVRHFYIAHLGVRYEIYTLSFPFDLRCQRGILQNMPMHGVLLKKPERKNT